MISGNYDFKKDVVIGQDGEQVIKNHLISIGYEFIKFNKTKEYDLLMKYNNKEIKFEIKTDVFPRDTGNIAIEFESRGYPSGIESTESDVFLTYFFHLSEMWIISTTKLKRLLKQKSEKFKIVENVGDKDSKTKLYLLNKNVWKKHFKAIRLN